MQKSGCPTDETLALFLEGRLGSRAREGVVSHVAVCAECRDIVNSADELRAAEAVPAVAARRPRRLSRIAALAGLAAAAALAYALLLGPLGDRLLAPQRVRALAAATEELTTRPIAARPSVDMAYRPHEVLRATEREKLGYADLLTAASKIEGASRRHPTATNLHHLGLAHLLLSEQDQAVEALEGALRKETDHQDVASALVASRDADLLNDLAAAYNERRSVGARDQQHAMTAVTRAWELKKTAPVAWTRATVLASPEGWTDYLHLDGTSEWAVEAREKLAQSAR